MNISLDLEFVLSFITSMLGGKRQKINGDDDGKKKKSMGRVGGMRQESADSEVSPAHRGQTLFLNQATNQ